LLFPVKEISTGSYTSVHTSLPALEEISGSYFVRVLSVTLQYSHYRSRNELKVTVESLSVS
jgi:hypothetical protein